jgi:hypothetical protein
MNLRRGFFRLWLVASIVWIIAVAVEAYRDTSIPSLTRPCSTLLDFTANNTGENLGEADVAKCDQVWREDPVTFLETAIGPPSGSLLLGMVLALIIRGFRPRPA